MGTAGPPPPVLDINPPKHPYSRLECARTLHSSCLSSCYASESPEVPFFSAFPLSPVLYIKMVHHYGPAYDEVTAMNNMLSQFRASKRSAVRKKFSKPPVKLACLSWCVSSRSMKSAGKHTDTAGLVEHHAFGVMVKSCAPTYVAFLEHTHHSISVDTACRRLCCLDSPSWRHKHPAHTDTHGYLVC